MIDSNSKIGNIMLPIDSNVDKMAIVSYGMGYAVILCIPDYDTYEDHCYISKGHNAISAVELFNYIVMQEAQDYSIEDLPTKVWYKITGSEFYSILENNLVIYDLDINVLTIYEFPYD